jgi:hypothetical protein
LFKLSTRAVLLEARVRNPSRRRLETDPGHAIWKRNFSGASGLFSIVPKPQAVVDVLLYNLKLFGMGYSRGRVREPRHSVRLHGLPIHHQMGAGGTGSAASYPA